MANTKGQADYRRDINPRDQFGRKWLTVIEKATGDPCSEVVPVRWTDPLRTPMYFVRMLKNEDGQTDTTRVTVDFGSWIAQNEAAEGDWYKQLHQNALHMYKAIEPGTDLTRDKMLVDLTGPKPFPSVAVLQAAEGGDRQYLGFEELDGAHRIALRMQTLQDMRSRVAEPPESVLADDAPPPDTYQAFVSWNFKKGLRDLKAIGALWQEHRKNLQAV